MRQKSALPPRQLSAPGRHMVSARRIASLQGAQPIFRYSVQRREEAGPTSVDVYPRGTRVERFPKADGEILSEPTRGSIGVRRSIRLGDGAIVAPQGGTRRLPFMVRQSGKNPNRMVKVPGQDTATRRRLRERMNDDYWDHRQPHYDQKDRAISSARQTGQRHKSVSFPPKGTPPSGRDIRERPRMTASLQAAKPVRMVYPSGTVVEPNGPVSWVKPKGQPGFNTLRTPGHATRQTRVPAKVEYNVGYPGGGTFYGHPGDYGRTHKRTRTGMASASRIAALAADDYITEGDGSRKIRFKPYRRITPADKANKWWDGLGGQERRFFRKEYRQLSMIKALKPKRKLYGSAALAAMGFNKAAPRPMGMVSAARLAGLRAAEARPWTVDNQAGAIYPSGTMARPVDRRNLAGDRMIILGKGHGDRAGEAFTVRRSRGRKMTPTEPWRTSRNFTNNYSRGKPYRARKGMASASRIAALSAANPIYSRRLPHSNTLRERFPSGTTVDWSTAHGGAVYPKDRSPFLVYADDPSKKKAPRNPESGLTIGRLLTKEAKRKRIGIASASRIAALAAGMHGLPKKPSNRGRFESRRYSTGTSVSDTGYKGRSQVTLGPSHGDRAGEAFMVEHRRGHKRVPMEPWRTSRNMTNNYSRGKPYKPHKDATRARRGMASASLIAALGGALPEHTVTQRYYPSGTVTETMGGGAPKGHNPGRAINVHLPKRGGKTDSFFAVKQRGGKKTVRLRGPTGPAAGPEVGDWQATVRGRRRGRADSNPIHNFQRI